MNHTIRGSAWLIAALICLGTTDFAPEPDFRNAILSACCAWMWFKHAVMEDSGE